MSPQKILMSVASLMLIGVAALGVPSVASAQSPNPAPGADATDKAEELKQRLIKLQALLRATGLQAGVVVTNTDGTLTLKTGKESLQVQTNDKTIVVVAGKKQAKVADVRAGDLVVVEFPNQDASKPASFVMSFPKGFKVENLRLGAVIGVRRNGMALRTPQGNEPVTMNNATVVIDLNKGIAKKSSVDDLKQGNAVLVVGTSRGKVFQAQTVIVLDKNTRDLLDKAKQK